MQMNNPKQASPSDKPFGIRVDLPKDDPMSAPHLLGDDWAGTRWFESAELRDAAMEAMRRQPNYYRRGDTPSVVLSAIDPS